MILSVLSGCVVLGADTLYAAHPNQTSKQTWKKSSCSALRHQTVKWAYRNEKELLQAASHVSFNASKALLYEQKHRTLDNETTTFCISNDNSNNVSTRNASQDNLGIRKVCDLPVPRVAFLFLVRGALAHETLWRRFFATSPAQNRYSIYVHANPKFRFPRGSLFHCKHIPSANVARFSFSVVDAMRRLLAYALLDASANNQHFIFVCEATIPIRSFAYTYDYLINSNLSYVQAFKPTKEYLSWSTLPLFPSKALRKGEMWMSLTRRHARMIVGDVAMYKKFKANCKRERRMCTPDEQYIQTLLSLQDPSGLAYKTIMFVDWRSHARLDKGSPSTFSKAHVRPALLRHIQRMKQPWRLRRPANLTCSRLPSDCPDSTSVPFLFARKFAPNSAVPLANLSPLLLGY